MRVGIHLPHIGRKAGPQAIRRAAVQAEELGFADAWASEHIIVPRDAPYPPSAIFYDPVLTLTWAAACTNRIGLGTSVLVLPMRHPLPLAKELATLQNLSEGRLILGAGVGWLEAEFAALGAPFAERGRRMDEGIALMRAVWSQDPVSFAKDGYVVHMFQKLMGADVIKTLAFKRPWHLFDVMHDVDARQLSRVEINPACFDVMTATEIQFWHRRGHAEMSCGPG